MNLYLILNNIRSMENVGSIFRTADAAGVKKILLCGLTPRPPRKEIDKAALGAVDFVDWEYIENINTLISSFKKQGFTIVALEQDKRSIQYTKYKILNTAPLALIVGNEVDGVDKKVLDSADYIIEIPMHGQKNSLNVAVTTGIALFELIK
jgi:23S rRNA (guanosine2251-2'-O)-methyltransferase